MICRRSLTALLLSGIASCGPEVHYETLSEDVGRFCDLAFGCYIPKTPDYIERCEHEFIDYSEEALGEGENCANRFSQLVRCVSNMTCEQLLNWDFSENDPTVDYPCKQENLNFLAACASTWYADQA